MSEFLYCGVNYGFFFVLNGLLDGEEGVNACYCGSGEQMKDGWYFHLLDGEGEEDGHGPHKSQDAAERAAFEFIDEVAAA